MRTDQTVPVPVPVLVLALLAACHHPTPQEKAARDARDVAEVEAVQKVHPPVQHVRLQPMKPQVRGFFKLSQAGCDFLADGGPDDGPVLIAGDVKAVLTTDGHAMILAADSGSARLPRGAHAKYVGRTHYAQLAPTRNEAAGAADAGRQPAALTIYDRFDRVVYFARGALICHG